MRTLVSRHVALAILWIAAYVTIVTAPLFVLLLGPMPPGRGFWWELAMALGFSATAMMGVQFALTARFRRASAPFGVDILYSFHRHLGILAVGIVVAHYGIIRIGNPGALGPLDPLRAPLHMTAGRLALLLLAVLLATSLWRKRLRIGYERWRLLHALLSIAVLLLALLHVEMSGYYIQTSWKRVLWTAYGAFWLLLLVYIRLLKPWRMLRRPYRLLSVRPEGDETWTVELRPEGHPGLRFQPGQFAWVTLGGSPFRFREHPFSFSSSAERRGGVEFSIKELGDFTRTVKDLRPGRIAYVDGPYGAFTIDRRPEAPGFVFVAGGVGIAPVLSMLRTMRDRGDRRPSFLFYGTRRPDGAPFRAEIEGLAAGMNLSLVHVVEQATSDWRGERGFVDRALLARYLPADRSRLEYFLCGPNAMRRAVEQALVSLGVPLTRIHVELFEWV